jgi:hypothetical protein
MTKTFLSLCNVLLLLLLLFCQFTTTIKPRALGNVKVVGGQKVFRITIFVKSDIFLNFFCRKEDSKKGQLHFSQHKSFIAKICGNKRLHF